MAVLPGDLFERIQELCREGRAHAGQGAFRAAVLCYREAWELVPEPRLEWEGAAWIQTAIADAHFLDGAFEEALEPLRLALRSGGLGNPLVHLRLGQCLLESGRREEALRELSRAYMGGGREIFAGADPRYLAALRGALRPPPGEEEP